MVPGRERAGAERIDPGASPAGSGVNCRTSGAGEHPIPRPDGSTGRSFRAVAIHPALPGRHEVRGALLARESGGEVMVPAADSPAYSRVSVTGASLYPDPFTVPSITLSRTRWPVKFRGWYPGELSTRVRSGCV